MHQQRWKSKDTDDLIAIFATCSNSDGEEISRETEDLIAISAICSNSDSGGIARRTEDLIAISATCNISDCGRNSKGKQTSGQLEITGDKRGKQDEYK